MVSPSPPPSTVAPVQVVNPKHILLVGEFYYGRVEGDWQMQRQEHKTNTTFKCQSCLKVLKNNIRYEGMARLWNSSLISLFPCFPSCDHTKRTSLLRWHNLYFLGVLNKDTPGSISENRMDLLAKRRGLHWESCSVGHKIYNMDKHKCFHSVVNNGVFMCLRLRTHT